MNTDSWDEYRGIIKNKQVIEFIRFGFPTGHLHQSIPSASNINHATAIKYPDHVDRYIITELKHGALIGPFKIKPFEWTMVSPLLTREKNSSTERRVIMDLSYPPGHSVNSGIPKEEFLGADFTLKLPSALTLKAMVRAAGQGALMWSRDLARSYRQLRSCPLDWPLLCIAWRNSFFFDCSVPFGLRTGAKAMQEVTEAVTDVLNNENITSIGYIDDLAGVDINRDRADRGYKRCGTLFTELGIVEAEKKCTPPATRMTWLGVVFDSENMTMRIPQNKIQEIHATVCQWENREKCSQSQLKSLLGRLFFAASCSSILRLFCNRMLATLRRDREKPVIALDKDFHEDIAWISKFLVIYNGIDVIPAAPTWPHPLIVDSCLTGGGTLGK